MPEFNKEILMSRGDSSIESGGEPTIGDNVKDKTKRQLKKELIEVFQKFGYLGEMKDYEVRIKTTSGNIAWINIRSIETIK